MERDGRKKEVALISHFLGPSPSLGHSFPLEKEQGNETEHECLPPAFFNGVLHYARSLNGNISLQGCLHWQLKVKELDFSCLNIFC